MKDDEGRAMSNVTLLHNRMTEAEYEQERQRLRDTYGDSSVEAAAKRDQAMALLFARSNWTQEELAAKEGKSQGYIARRLRFGQFLTFMPTGINAESLPTNLTEGRFRGFWEQTDKADNDRKRYSDVAAAITAASQCLPGMPKGTKSLGPELLAEFGDGKWHDVQTIIDHFPEDDPKRVTDLLESIRIRGVFGAKAEVRKFGRSFQHRVYPADKKISVSEVKMKLAPLIQGLKEEGKKNMATMSPGTVARLAALIQRQIDEWSE
jgi:hypothetical protein